jgi:hypothetical protein
MSGQIAETTAMQRLGHVLGWAGFAFGGLTILVGMVAILINAWSYFFPTVDGTGYRVELNDGQSYIALGTRHDGDDAEKAIRKHIGEEVSFGPYGDWKVFSAAEASGDRADEFALEKKKVRALKMARIRRDALSSMTLATLFGIVPGILIILLGLALRYIFAGPIKRTR